jgi:hypothetical protein
VWTVEQWVQPEGMDRLVDLGIHEGYNRTNKIVKCSEIIDKDINKKYQEMHCIPFYVLHSLLTALYLKFQNVNQSCSCL